MWIFSTMGFISVVAANGDTDDLLVRSRDKDSIDGVVDGVSLFLDEEDADLEINDSERMSRATDYPYGVRVPREAFVQWLAHDVREYLNYGNFKSALSESRGEPFTSVAHKVWGDALALTEPGQEDFGYGYARMFG